VDPKVEWGDCPLDIMKKTFLEIFTAITMIHTRRK